MMSKKILAILLSLSMIGLTANMPVFSDDIENATTNADISLMATTASGTCGDNLTWVLDGDGTLTISGTGDMNDYGSGTSPWTNYREEIQKVIIAYGVTSIGNNAFNFDVGKNPINKIANVAIPESVTRIGNHAFYECSNLINVTIPNSVTTIENGAFSECSNLNTIVIPDSVTSIGNSIFHYCVGLTYVKLSNNITSIGNGVFENCKSIKDIIIPENVTYIGDSAFSGCSSLNSIKINNNVTIIGQSSFYGCSSLTSITIPNSVTDIGNRAFQYCSGLTNIVISSGVTSIGLHAFANCASLLSIEVSPSNTYYKSENGILFTKDGTELIKYPPAKVDNGYKIPFGVTSIAGYAFDACDNLTYLTIPNSVIKFGSELFTPCQNLMDIYYIGRQSQWSNISGGMEGRRYLEITQHYLLDDTILGQSANETTSWDYTFGGEYHYWEITPSESATYEFESTLSSGDSYGCLYDEKWNEIVSDDDSGNGSNFKIKCDLILGNTYYYGVKWYSQSNTGSIPVKLTKTKLETVSTPTISTSNIIGGKSVSISCTTSGATIYYTTNGSNPTTSSTRYTSAINLTSAGTTTVKAIAVRSGYTNSSVASQSVTISKAATPTASQASGAITSPINVTLSSPTSGAAIYYTTDGSTPTTNSNRYSSAININSTTTLKIIAAVSGYANSDVATYNYTYSAPSKTFTMLRDNFSFANTWSSFGYSYSYHIPLERYISVFGVTEGTQRYNSDGTWGGSCYGFSSTSTLFFENKLNYKQYSPSATSLFSISAPKTPKANLTILMERYQIAQSLYSVSSERSNNWNRMDKIIQAVKHFEETGDDPIVLCMWSYFAGHAVVPYKCVTNSDGSYSIYVYDNNYPSSTSRIVNINKNMNGFSYDSYSRAISFNYAETMYDALQGGVSLFSVEDEQEDVATLTVNSDKIKITDVNGVSIENIDGAYEVIPVERDFNQMQKTYVIPNGDYIVQNNSTDIDNLQISISNSKDYQIITTDDLKATANVGVYASTGRVYAYINSTKTSNQSIKTLSDTGVSKLFEAVGKSLGASAANSSSMEIVADSSVSVNGIAVSVGTTGEVGSTSISTMVDVNGSGSGKDFETVVSKNSLTYSNGSVNGKLSYLIYNNTQSLSEARVIVGLYSDDGQLVSIIKNDDEVLALGSNYIDLGTLNYFGLNKSGYKVKCFVWDSLDNMQPLAEATSTEI